MIHEDTHRNVQPHTHLIPTWLSACIHTLGTAPLSVNMVQEASLFIPKRQLLSFCKFDFQQEPQKFLIPRGPQKET